VHSLSREREQSSDKIRFRVQLDQLTINRLDFICQMRSQPAGRRDLFDVPSNSRQGLYSNISNIRIPSVRVYFPVINATPDRTSRLVFSFFDKETST